LVQWESLILLGSHKGSRLSVMSGAHVSVSWDGYGHNIGKNPFRSHTRAEVQARTDTLVRQPPYLVTRGWEEVVPWGD
jgi:hypothetical protein